MKRIWALLIVILALIITIVFSFKLNTLVLSGDFTALFPWDENSDTYTGGVLGQSAITASNKNETTTINTDIIVSKDYKTGLHASLSNETESDLNYTSTMYVLVYSDEIYTPSFLDALEKCIDEIDARKDSARPKSVLDWFTLSGEDGYMEIESMSPKTGKFWTEFEAKELEKRVKNDPIVPYYLVGGSGNSFLLEFIYHDEASSNQIEDLESVFSPLEEMGARVILMSNMVISNEVISALKKDLYLLASLALLLMVVVYYLSFRTMRAVIIPFFLSISAIIWTLSTMAMLGIELNLLTILTPCLVLILGSTYSIHMLNEYYLGRRRGEWDVIASSRHIVKTIVLGALTTIFGFLSLSFAPSHTLLGFGVSVSFGVFYSALLAVFVLPAILILLPSPTLVKLEKMKKSPLNKLIDRLAPIIVKLWPLFIVLFLVLSLVFFCVKDKISVDSNYMSYFREDDEFGSDCRFFSSELGGTTPFTVTIEAPEGEENFFLDYDNLSSVFEWENRLKESRHVLQIISFPEYVAFASKELLGKYEIPSDSGVMNILRSVLISYASSFPEMESIVSSNFNKLTLTIQTWDGDKKDLITMTSVKEVYDEMVEKLYLLPYGTKVTVSGYPVISEKFSSRLLSDQKISTVVSIVLIFAISSLFFLSIVKGALVLIPVAAGIMINYIFMYFMNIPFDIITVSFSSIAIGCGVDDALHFTLRYIEYNRKEKNVKKVVSKTLKNTSRPIILTTLSVLSGMLMLSFGSYTPIRYFGLLMSVTLFSSMLSTLIFLPSWNIFVDYIKSLFDGRAYIKQEE